MKIIIYSMKKVIYSVFIYISILGKDLLFPSLVYLRRKQKYKEVKEKEKKMKLQRLHLDCWHPMPMPIPVLATQFKFNSFPICLGKQQGII